MEAIDELVHLSESMMQASALLADEDVDESSSSKRTSTFLNVVALGNVVSSYLRPCFSLSLLKIYFGLALFCFDLMLFFVI